MHALATRQGLVIAGQKISLAPVPASRVLRECCTPSSLKKASFTGLVQPNSTRPFAGSAWRPHSNGKKRGKTTTVKLQDLPQGMLTSGLPPAPESEPVPSPSYPTVVQQARDNMRKFDGCVVLTQVGSFYELYFEQAQHWGTQLNLKVASKKTTAGPVAMAGFPLFQLERYLKVLVQEFGKHVAIAEETANDMSQKVKSGGLMFDRQIKRIVTPGTLIDENFLSPTAHNYLLAVYICELGMQEAEVMDQELSASKVGLAWIDLSSGDFYTQVTDFGLLSTTINRIGPGEIIFDKTLHGTRDARLASVISECGQKTTFYQMPPFDADKAWRPMIEVAAKGIVDDAFSSEEKKSASALLAYIQEQLPGLKLQLQSPQRYQAQDHMSIDKHTIRGLELLRTMRDGGYQGSLLHAICRTSTRSGARLLSERLTSPSMSIAIIKERLDLIEALITNDSLLNSITALLRSTADSFRLVQSLACGKGDAEDLLSLARTIAIMRDIANLITKSTTGISPIVSLVKRFQWKEPEHLAQRISHAIDEEGLMQRRRSEEDEASEAAGIARKALSADEGDDLVGLTKRLNAKKYTKVASEGEDEIGNTGDIWVMRRDASETLTSLHTALDDLYRTKTDLTTSLKHQLSAPSLTLRMSPGLGHYVHLKGRDVKASLSSLADARTVSISKSTKSLHLPPWTSLGGRLEDAKYRIRAEESQILKSLRENVCEEIVALRRNAGVVDDLDVACSGAILAKERNLVRPILDESTGMTVIAGRHMTVEASLEAAGRSFTPNDCSLGLPVPDPISVDVVPTTTAPSDPSAPNPTTTHDSYTAPSTQSPTKESIHILTGPNMAGKSTYLRTLAHLPILAQTGLYVPAHHCTLGLTDAVFSRIGASDDLARDQSTFMVEMVETAAILRRATSRSLVVMDEVGRGTTPEDGVAVGFAVLEGLRRRGVGRVSFATHFHDLVGGHMCGGWRECGLWCTRVVEDEGLGWRFDHKVKRGVNRESHALRVARLAGMPEDCVEVAAEVLRGAKKKASRLTV